MAAAHDGRERGIMALSEERLETVFKEGTVTARELALDELLRKGKIDGAQTVVMRIGGDGIHQALLQ